MYSSISNSIVSVGLYFGAAVGGASCHDYVIIATRGTYEHQGPSIAFKNMTANTLEKIPNGIAYDTVYPAAPNQTYYLGTNDIVSYIDTGLKDCPSQSYALLGYSQGATATMTALRNYTKPDTPGYEAIKAVLLVGNPAHKPFQQANVDQYGSNTTNAFLGSGYFSGPRVPEVWYRNTRTIDICYEGDIVCNGPGTISSLIPHLRYGNTPSVQAIGTNFLIANLFPEK